MKTGASSAKLPTEPAPKKQRRGVGTSVAELKLGPLDNFVITCCKINVEQLRPNTTKIQTIRRSDTVHDLFMLLVDKNIHSVPVVTDRGQYYGFVDMSDVVWLATNLLERWSEVNEPRLTALFAKESIFSKTLVKDIITSPVRKFSPFHPHFVGTSLFSAWESLAKDGVSRVPVINSTLTETTRIDNIDDIITHSMMIDFLWQNIEKITTGADMKVSAMSKPTLSLGSIRENDTAIAAFRSMIHYGYSGLAILDKDGKLVGNISLRDLKGILTWTARSWLRLWDTVGDFKKQILKDFPNHPSRVLCVLNNDTLYDVVEKMALEKVHRVYVVDSLESMKPIRVITQTDVLKQLLDSLEKVRPVHASV